MSQLLKTFVTQLNTIEKRIIIELENGRAVFTKIVTTHFSSCDQNTPTQKSKFVNCVNIENAEIF